MTYTPWILALTGGIGSGNTAAAERFTAHGIEVVDADHASRWVVEPGQPALAKLVAHFGERVLNAEGTLNRGALRELIFADPAERQWVEALLHPLIGAEIEARLARATSPYAIYMAPLVVETGNRRGARRVLVVDVPSELQVERTLARDGTSEAQVRAILQAQASREQRLAWADDVIVNDRDLAWLHAEVDRLHSFYLTLPGAPA